MPIPKGYKHSEEAKRKIRESVNRSVLLNPEKHSYWKGKKQPTEMQIKKSLKMKGRSNKHIFTEEMRRNMSLAQKGKPRLNLRGEKHGNWKGGIKSLLHRVRHSIPMKIWRNQIFKRDFYSCILCGDHNFLGRGKTVYLEVDHFPVSFKELMERNQIKTLEEAENCSEFWNIKNGRTLCLDCHNKTKKGNPRSKS